MVSDKNMEALADIQVTENAAKQIRVLLDESEDHRGKALRVHVEGGGCSGMQYGMMFDRKKADDVMFSQHGVDVLIDPQSLEFLKGSTIDYVESIQGSGFRIQNPNAKTSCGCGKSFQ
jgi:iron-sulfur cluster assembly accessory protein